MVEKMDTLHVYGVDVIVKLQATFKGNSEYMLALSHLGDPRNAFLIYFPLAYFCHHSVGKRVLFLAAIAEWLNAVLKWFLHGERPYWWVNEEKSHWNTTVRLQQYKLTCETGPGSPSGHAMVTSAVWFVMVSSVLHYAIEKHRAVWSVLLWTWFSVFMLCVSVSRCFIATHFPHQVLAGTFTGILLAWVVCTQISTNKLQLKHYVITSLWLLVSSLGVYSLLQQLGVDPAWSISKASRWCARPEWIHLDTTPLFALMRDAGQILGLGIGVCLIKEPILSSIGKLLCIPITIGLTLTSEQIKVPVVSSTVIFYTMALYKHTMLPIVVVGVVPRIMSILFSGKVEKETKTKNS
ncbi:unnamed protein product [Owenia fusiformis]|uniref:Glucose-6-phosphatase n=1 Tax=Owenia fusiformis TaxID=6347 RepID=A0A8J1YA25_OWEFU|nr:unnamed protein product [Owenia fusiformis]